MPQSTTTNTLDPEIAKAVAEQHFRNVKDGVALKVLPHRQVSRVVHDAEKFVVKSYRINLFRRIFNTFPFSTDYAVLLEGLTPPLRANFAYSFNCQVTVVDDAGDMDMFRLFSIAPLPPDFKTTFHEAGKLLAKIHSRQLFHADTKSPNFVINTNLPSLPPMLIIDCDKVKRFKVLPFEKRVFNLAQFLACWSKKCPANYELYPTAMSSFLDGYADESELTRDEISRMAASAVECALTNHKIELRIPHEILKSLSFRK